MGSESVKSAVQAFAGTWIKDGAASDSLEPMLQLGKSNRFLRRGARLVRGVELDIGAENFNFSMFTRLPFLKVRERYPWSGELQGHRRRDMRRGQATGKVTVTPKGTIRVQASWGEPLAGQADDEFSIDEQGRLHMVQVTTIGGETVRCRTVYNRRGSQRGEAPQPL